MPESTASYTGRIIGARYRMGEMIGQGGMATVYKGQDTLTHEHVAIKLLKPDIISADPGMVERFAREGEALRRLNHPNIVKVLATVEEDDENFVIMEYVGGGDLRDLLDDHRSGVRMIPVNRVLEIALDLSDALTRAHRLKIIHRDIKPANVLLAEDGTPRLTDFGVAQFADATRMTQSGAMVGTLAYLSPEACSGMELDTRADIWSFGVMLYELLTLRRPFEEGNTAALLATIITREPEPLADLRPDAPPELITLVENMLIKDRDQRTNSVRLVGTQLESIISGKEMPSRIDNDNTPTLRDAAQAVSDYRAGRTTPPPPSTASVAAGSVAAAPVGQAPQARRRVYIGAGIAIAVIALLIAVVLLTGGDDGDSPSAAAIASDTPAAPTPSPTRDAASPEGEATLGALNIPVTREALDNGMLRYTGRRTRITVPPQWVDMTSMNAFTSMMDALVGMDQSGQFAEILRAQTVENFMDLMVGNLVSFTGVLIAVEEVGLPIPLDVLQTRLEALANSMPGAEPVYERVEIPAGEAIRVTANTGSLMNFAYMQYGYYLPVGSRIYWVIFISNAALFEENRAAFDAAIQTFELLEE